MQDFFFSIEVVVSELEISKAIDNLYTVFNEAVGRRKSEGTGKVVNEAL